MQKKYNKTLIPYAKALRREMTAEERHLWYDFLRMNPHKFVRQKVLGRYIADFYCASESLVIELDGSQHYEESDKQYDFRRTEFIEEYGIRVIRIPNNEIHRNFEGVCIYIDEVLKHSKKSNKSPQSAAADSSRLRARSGFGPGMPKGIPVTTSPHAARAPYK